MFIQLGKVSVETKGLSGAHLENATGDCQQTPGIHLTCTP
jgi:hypothetical protein